MKKNIVWFITIIIFIGVISWIIINRSKKVSTHPITFSSARVAINALAPEVFFSDINGSPRKLSDFKGKKVMLWSVATWCSSCSEGAHILAQNKVKLKNLNIIALKTYGNAGYPGPRIEKFASQSAPSTLRARNWLWGNFSKESTRIYNPRNYPDIYFLINKNGIIRSISDAPAATIGAILKFANN